MVRKRTHSCSVSSDPLPCLLHTVSINNKYEENLELPGRQASECICEVFPETENYLSVGGTIPQEKRKSVDVGVPLPPTSTLVLLISPDHEAKSETI